MKKFKIFKKESLVVASKIIVSKDSFIQIRNITRIWHGKPNVDIPAFKLFLILSLAAGLMQTPFSFLGFLVLLGAFAAIGYYIYLCCLYTLNFEMSSGEVYAFSSLKSEFLLESYEKVKSLINDEKLRDKNYEINFNSCDISVVKGDHNNVINGKNNIINSGDNNQINQNDNSHNVDNSTNILNANKNSNNKKSFNNIVNYDSLLNEIKSLLELNELKSNKEDIDLLEKSQKYAEAKNEKMLKSTLSKLSKATLTIINTTASFATLAGFILGK